MNDQVAAVSSPKLTSGHLSFMEVFAYAFSLMGTSASVVILIPLVFINGGNGTWLVFLMAMIAYLLVAAQVNVFTRRIASPGSLYTYVREGLGPIPAAVTGWSLLIGYYVFIPTNLVAVAYFALQFVRILNGQTELPNAPELQIGLTIIIALIAWGMAYRDVRLSARFTLGIEFVTLGLIALIVGGYLWHSGLHLDPAQASLQGVNGKQLVLALVLAMATFTGFDAAAALGTEARNPFIAIARATTLTITVGGGVVLISAYVLVQAFHDFATPLNSDQAPMSTLATSIGLGPVASYVFGGIVISCFGCLLGCLNTAARLLYSFSEHGLLSGSGAKAHARFGTPHVAVTIMAVLGLSVSLALELSGIAPMDIFNYCASVAAYGFLIAYIMVSVAAPVYLKRHNLLKPVHVASSALAVFVMLIPIVGSFYPVPDWPYTILPFIFLAMLLAGVGYFFYLRKFRPAALQHIIAEYAGDPTSSPPD